jgi:hypothetical protein
LIAAMVFNLPPQCGQSAIVLLPIHHAAIARRTVLRFHDI